MSKKPYLYPDRIKPGTNKYRKYTFWHWYLTTAVLNLFDVQNMEQDMETSFKLSLLLGGRVVFFQKNGKTWALPFANGGEVPVYAGEIIRVLVINPVLGEFTGTPGIDCECVYLTPLDRVQMAAGYSALIDETADALSDNDLSIKTAQFNKRLPTVFVGHTTPERIGMETVLESVRDGETNIIAQTALDKSIQRLDAGQSTVAPLSEFTEYQQYKLGLFYNMLGVNAVWNTKRERVAASENDVSGETARYNVADVVDNLNLQLDAVNKRFGTEYRVELNLIKSAEIEKQINDAAGETEVEPDANTTDNAESAETG